MPGIGFVLFVLPVLFGVAAGFVLVLLPGQRRFAAYAFFIPTVGALGALAGSVAAAYFLRSRVLVSLWPVIVIFMLGFVLGGVLGCTCGALVAKLVNRLIRP